MAITFLFGTTGRTLENIYLKLMREFTARNHQTNEVAMLWHSLLDKCELFRVVNLPGNKSISQGSGKYWEILGNTGK